MLHYGGRALNAHCHQLTSYETTMMDIVKDYVVKLFVVGMVGMTLQFNAPLLNPKIENVGIGSHIYDFCRVLLMLILSRGYF